MADPTFGHQVILTHGIVQLSIGTLIGALIAGPLANNKKLGRKYSLVLWSIVFCVGVIVQIAALKPRWYEVMVGRIIAGLAIGGKHLHLVMSLDLMEQRHSLLLRNVCDGTCVPGRV